MRGVLERGVKTAVLAAEELGVRGVERIEKELERGVEEGLKVSKVPLLGQGKGTAVCAAEELGVRGVERIEKELEREVEEGLKVARSPCWSGQGDRCVCC